MSVLVVDLVKKYVLSILIVFIILLSVVFRLVSAQGLAGDQIHYLVMTQSLLEDGDFDLKEDHDQDKYLDYFHEELDPHIRVDQFDDSSDSWYSLHNPGLPILLAPFFGVAGYYGAIFLMFLLGALNLYLVYKWSYSVLHDHNASIFCMILYGFSSFFLSLGGYIFPNLLLSSLSLLAMLITFKEEKNWKDNFLLSLVLGMGVWVHVKMLLMFAIIGFYNLGQLFLKYRDRSVDGVLKRNFIALTLPVTILLVMFEWKLYQWYGVWLPTSTFASGQMFELYPWFSLSAVLFDFIKGILFSSPSFYILFIGLPIWYASNKINFIKLILFVLPGLLLQLTFGDWWGGWAPNGRYFVEVLPLFLPAAGFVYICFLKLNPKLKYKLNLILLFQLIFASLYLYYRPGWVLPGYQNMGIFISFMPFFGQSTIINLENSWFGLLLCICLSVLMICFGVMLSKKFEYSKNVKLIG